MSLRGLHRAGPSPGRIDQMAVARARLARPRGRLASFVKEDEAWGLGVRWLLEQDEQWGPLSIETARLHALARKEARAEASERGRQRCKAYWSWIDEQLRSGAGGLHRICRPQPAEVVQAVPVVGPPGDVERLSAMPQDLLEKEAARWKPVWHRLPLSDAPWREGSGKPVGEPLPP